MAVSYESIIQAVNTKITAGNLTTEEISTLYKILDIVNNHTTQIYANISSLPIAKNNTGKFVYVQSNANSVGVLYYSDGSNWVNYAKSTYSQLLYGTGENAYGSLGKVGVEKTSSVISIAGNFEWNAIGLGGGGGDNSIAAIKSDDNTLWTWGRNNYGQVGDGTTIDKSSPVSVLGGFTWKKVSSGKHVMAIRSDDTIWTWGKNFNGALGINAAFVDKSSPVSLVAPANSWAWKQISASYTSMAIKSDNTLWSWGSNNFGQLGDGFTVARSSPVSLIAPANSWTWISIASSSHSVAIKSDYTIWSWGLNYYGSLGDGTKIDRSSPVSLIAPANSWTWKQISTNGPQTLAIKSDSTLWAWGYGTEGKLGDGFTVNRSSPVSVLGGFTWNYVAAGYHHTIGIRSDNTLWSWGRNNIGQLGDGTVIDKSSPISCINAQYGWKTVAANYWNSFAIAAKGS